MSIKIFGLLLSIFVALVHAKDYKFSVVSLLGPEYYLAVQIGGEVMALSNDKYPLFKGTVKADNISQYNYVVLDSSGQVIDTENIQRTYSDATSKLNEVYNRTTKTDINIPDLPRPFKNLYPMGSENFKPIPKNVIYNVFATCDDTYSYIANNPFILTENGTKDQNNNPTNCTFNIISPQHNFHSTGSMHVIGYGSRQYKKLSWAMKFEKKFLGRKAVKLRAMANDPTLVREKLATELYKAVGVPVQEGTYARLIINGDVYGLYTIVDSFSSRWLAAYVHGNENKEIGFSYKMYTSGTGYPDFRYLGENYSEYINYLPDEYEETNIAANPEQMKYERIIEFTRLYTNWVDTYDEDMSDTAVTELERILDIETVLRILVIDTLILALDNFWLRMSNAAVYYNPETNYFQILPYDFDKVLLGRTDDQMLDSNYIYDCFNWANQHEDLIEHFFTNHLLKHPQIKQRYDVILAKTSRETFASDAIAGFVDAAADLIREDVQWNFEAIDQLAITYDGLVNRFTLTDFENNLKYEPVPYNKGVSANDAEFGLQEFVDLRGNNCKAATETVDLSNNENIISKAEIPEFKAANNGEEPLSGSHSRMTSQGPIAFLILFSLYYFFF